MCLSVCEPFMTVCLCVSQGHSVVFRIYLLREQVVGFSVALKDDVTKVILWLSQEISSSQDESGHKEDTIFIYFYMFHWESSDHLGSCFHGFINSYDFDQSILAP